MTTLSDYLDNKHWLNIYKYAMNAPNRGYYRRWIQGSVGMMEPLPLWSNEYGHVYMKHGQQLPNPYRGNIKNFSRSVTPHLQNQVVSCSNDTYNPAGCQTAAVQQVYTKDSNPYTQLPSVTAHPFNVSYNTGYSPYEEAIAPNDHRQD